MYTDKVAELLRVIETERQRRMPKPSTPEQKAQQQLEIAQTMIAEWPPSRIAEPSRQQTADMRRIFRRLANDAQQKITML